MKSLAQFGIGHISDTSNLRLETLVRIRWMAVMGQLAAVLIVWRFLEFEFSPLQCIFLIGASAFLNVVLSIRYPANQRLDPAASTVLLTYDIVQLALLLYLTGGLQNPFSVLLLVPVVISATTLPTPPTLFLGSVAISSATLLVFYHHPLPWFEGVELQLPRIYITGMWIAIISSMFFMAVYAFRVADEARKLSDALAATELVLQREQHLSNIDGLAAAAAHELGTPLATIALVSKEMMRELGPDSDSFEDAKLLRSQAERCREILKTLTSLSTQDEQHFGQVPFSAILEEVSEPHREFGIKIRTNIETRGPEPVCRRNPAILYGLGNILENAVDHAKSAVLVNLDWDDTHVRILINDDGKGFKDEMIEKIGEPFVTQRTGNLDAKGLGLGLFIAKTLLERSGANMEFSNSPEDGLLGAAVRIEWSRVVIEEKTNSQVDVAVS